MSKKPILLKNSSMVAQPGLAQNNSALGMQKEKINTNETNKR